MPTIKIPEKLEFLLDEYRYKIAYGGRGGAKSRAFAGALVGFASTASKERPERILCCREIQNSIKESVKKLIDNEIKRCGYLDLYNITHTSVINKQNDSEFIFSGLRDNIDSVKSMEGITRCWVEEAHSLSDFSLTKLIPTIREQGSEIWLSFNPEDEDDPVYVKFVVNEPPPRSKVVMVNYWDNPWFPDVLRDEMEWDKKRDYDKYLHVWEGECKQSSEEQVMFGCWEVKETPEPPENTIFRHGLDFGFSTDPMAGIRSWIEGRNLYIDHEVYGHNVEIDEMGAVLRQIPTMSAWPIIADNARPESISYLNRHDFNVVPCKKGKGSIEDGIALIKSFNVIIHPRCKETIREFRKYSYKVDPKTGKILPVIVDAWNHLIDALRYALEGETVKDTLIKEDEVIEAVGNNLVEDDWMYSPAVLGVYTKRFVNDTTCLTIRQGLKVIWQEEYDSIKPNELAFKINKLNKEHRFAMIFLDDGGVEPSGKSVASLLIHTGLSNVVAISLGAEADDEKAFYDRHTELWSRTRDWLVEGGDIPEEDDLVIGLSSPLREYDTKGRLKIEKLSATGKRVMRHPSRAMSLSYTFAVHVFDDITQEMLEPEAVPDF